MGNPSWLRQCCLALRCAPIQASPLARETTRWRTDQIVSKLSVWSLVFRNNIGKPHLPILSAKGNIASHPNLRSAQEDLPLNSFGKFCIELVVCEEHVFRRSIVLSSGR